MLHAVAAALMLVSSSSALADVQGLVVGVADGDSITVLDEHRVRHRVRLAGIDAPERGQDFGQRAKQNLARMALGRTALVIGDKVDRYGRLVGKVMVHEGDANLRQVQAGLAWHYKAYQREQTAADRAAYTDAETAARDAKAGLWASPHPVPPWEHRRERR